MVQGSFTRTERRLRQSIDWALVATYLVLIIIGWVNIYASIHSSNPPSILSWSARSGKQFVWILTSLGLAGIILQLLPPRIWEAVSVPFYVFVLGLLVLVIFVSSDVKGSHSWFDLGPVRFQPAEISKISTSLVLALIMSQPQFRITRLKDFLKAVAVIVLPMLVIVAESETGSALVYLGFIFVLYREGLSGWWLGLIALVVGLFIATLTLGSYWAILLLAAALLISNLRTQKHPGKLLGWGGAVILVLALIPWLWGLAGKAVQARMDYLQNRIWVPRAGESLDYFWSFVCGINPIVFLLVAAAVAVPLLLWRAYKKKRGFLAISLGAFVAGVLLVFSTQFIFDKVLKEHQRSRIEILLGMREDPSGVGYNVNQSKIAIGSGGFSGKGFLHGTQTTFGFVPEQSTDFIFCTVGEEWGFLGCLVVIALYVFLIARLMADAERCRGRFTRIYGYCAASCIFMHLFINVGMTVGLMPVIGIPLPLLSYGGSSLWSFTIMIFIFLALYREEKKYF